MKDKKEGRRMRVTAARRAPMANSEHLARLERGLDAWNEWRAQNLRVPPDLSGADLSRVDFGGPALSGLDLYGANLAETNLDNANLALAKFGKATLTAATLRNASLSGANFVGADLGRANLSGADLTRAVLSQASLVLTDLSGAKLIGAALAGTFFDRTVLVDAQFKDSIIVSYFVRVDLSVVPDLELARHLGPSSIDIDTIYLSGGKIPESFLRFAGVPDTFIAFAKSLVTNPIEFYSCFISYSTKDQDFADRLFADLQAKGVRCWFAPRDAQRGRKLHEQIEEAIRMHEKLLLILSANRMNSNWVKTEIANTRAREQRE